MKRFSFLLVTLAACGGTQGPGEEANNPAPATPSPTAPAKRPASSDVSFELPAIDVKGVVYEPDAMGRPGMALVGGKDAASRELQRLEERAETQTGAARAALVEHIIALRKTAIEKQRRLVQSTKDPVAKQAQAAILATLLYRQSKDVKAEEKALLKEARDTLRDVAQAVGDKEIDEVTLRLLGSYELLLEDYPAAEKAWQGLIDKDPKSKDVPDSRGWLAYAQLRQFKNAEALATVGTAPPDDKLPQLAYAMAWAKLRTGDGAGAWQAITTAARGWGQNPLREELERDVLGFAGRANIALDQVAPVVAALAKAKLSPQATAQQQQFAQYELLARLGLSGYALAGRWAAGIAALDKAVAVAGDAVPPNDRPVIRYSQADFTVRLDAPDAAGKLATQAVEALAACGSRCSAKDMADTYQNVYLMGRLFHNLYATANDRSYYQPAHDLYELTIPKLDPANRAQAEQDLKKLETTFRNLKVGTGTHDKSALGALLPRHNLEVQACYEAALGQNPKLGGSVVVNLESDASGAIKGVSTEPKAGAADLAAVAGCIADRVRQWKLPKRGMPGSTRIKLSYQLAVKK
ncbi:MAG TPA: AgmX/PglI C-terminal domain-containing protein [Kofleriaceae bacterium]